MMTMPELLIFEAAAEGRNNIIFDTLQKPIIQWLANGWRMVEVCEKILFFLKQYCVIPSAPFLQREDRSNKEPTKSAFLVYANPALQ